MCNKLASRHVRVGLADPSDVPRCDICESAPDGSSLCLQCDMIVHVGGKQTHGRYLLLRQRIEFPGDNPDHFEDKVLQPTDPADNGKEESMPKSLMKAKLHNHQVASIPQSEAIANNHLDIDDKMIDLNARPLQSHRQPSNTQTHGMHFVSSSNQKSVDAAPVGSFTSDAEK